MAQPRRSSSLPGPLPPLIGRTEQLAEVVRRIEEGSRLLTVTGIGGIGKTRLALQAGNYFRGSMTVTFVDLMPLHSPSLLLRQIAFALRLDLAETYPVIDQLAADLSARKSMLILDNLEHLLPSASPVIAELLEKCPELLIMVTSRLATRLAEEHVFHLLPMELPTQHEIDSCQKLSQLESVRLFSERATEAHPQFALTDLTSPPVARICVRTGGIPLAIELVASRVRHASPQSILEQLDAVLPVLTDEDPSTGEPTAVMEETFRWSYDLLPPDGQQVLPRLSVFRGGFDLGAVKAIAEAPPQITVNPLDVIGYALIDHGLVQRTDLENGVTRYTLLPPVEEFARGLLAGSGHERAVRIAHARHFLALAESLRPEIEGERGPEVLDWFELEHANLRVAMATLLGQGRRYLASRFALSMWKFLVVRRYIAEGRETLDAVLSLTDAENPEESDPELRYAAASFALHNRDLPRARHHAKIGMEIAKKLNDPLWQAGCLSVLAHAAAQEGDYQRAANHYLLVVSVMDSLIPRNPYVEHTKAIILVALSTAQLSLGDPEGSDAWAQEALTIWIRRRDKWGIGLAKLNLARLAYLRGDVDSALDLYSECLPLLYEIGDMVSFAEGLAGLAELAFEAGHVHLAAELFGASEFLSDSAHTPGAQVIEIDFLALRSRLEKALSADEIDAFVIRIAQEPELDFFEIVERSISMILHPDSGEVAPTVESTDQVNTPTELAAAKEAGLTKREQEILCLLELSDQEIADMNFIAYRTVTSHVTKIYSKLGVSNRAAALAWAFRNGLCQNGDTAD